MWWCDERHLALRTTFLPVLLRHCLHGVEFCGGSGGFVLGVLELQRRPWSCTVICVVDLVLGGGGISFLSGVVHCCGVSPADLIGIGVFTSVFGVVPCDGFCSGVE
ncbi:unnamed protein product [Trifolium pratense]|uniref:Uncharacterized protein n=1 Tax=Trifolium pratense TaxID=57577 RepID=A0ACB0LXX6_TRIPR|nr:unnamed protein product [Trifolium pratense]